MPSRSPAEREAAVEHALLLLKPGPLQGEVLQRLPARLTAAGLNVVAHCRRELQVDDVFASFKYTAPEYVAMWTSGACDALLVGGPDAPERALQVRDGLRAEFGRTRRDTYNLLHLSDTGWEFVRQFSLFFPDRPLKRHAGFGDLLLHAPRVPMRDLLHDSSLGAVGLVGGSQRHIDEARAAGVDAMCLRRYDDGGVRLIAAFLDAPAEEPGARSAASFFDWVHERGGLVFFDENDDRLPAFSEPRDAAASERLTPIALDLYRRQIEPYRRYGLDGLVVVHPRRSAFVLETVWELVPEGPFLQLGGSAGAAPPPSYAIDRREVVQVFHALSRG